MSFSMSKTIAVIVIIIVLAIISLYIASNIYHGSIPGIENIISSGKEFKP